MRQKNRFGGGAAASLALLVTLVAAAAAMNVSAAPLYEAQTIFEPPASDPQFHAHASCIVECPNGDLLACWYENGSLLPAPYFSGQRDKSDDVHIGGSRKARGVKTWEMRFVMADTFGVSDNNPCMVIDKQKRLILIYPTLVGVPEWNWDSGLLRYAVSTKYTKAGPPVWSKQNVLIPHVQGVKAVVESSLATLAEDSDAPTDKKEAFKKEMDKRLGTIAYYRLGWMPRAHPLLRSDGAVVLPLSNENFNVAAMAITQDGGDSWSYSNPVPQSGITQPTLWSFPTRLWLRSSGTVARSIASSEANPTTAV